MKEQNVVVIGAGPVGALAALYAAGRGHHVQLYELRGGMYIPRVIFPLVDSLLVYTLVIVLLPRPRCEGTHRKNVKIRIHEKLYLAYKC